jgi:hypothetical protein
MDRYRKSEEKGGPGGVIWELILVRKLTKSDTEKKASQNHRKYHQQSPNIELKSMPTPIENQCKKTNVEKGHEHYETSVFLKSSKLYFERRTP